MDSELDNEINTLIDGINNKYPHFNNEIEFTKYLQHICLNNDHIPEIMNNGFNNYDYNRELRSTCEIFYGTRDLLMNYYKDNCITIPTLYTLDELLSSSKYFNDDDIKCVNIDYVDCGINNWDDFTNIKGLYPNIEVLIMSQNYSYCGDHHIYDKIIAEEFKAFITKMKLKYFVLDDMQTKAFDGIFSDITMPESCNAIIVHDDKLYTLKG